MVNLNDINLFVALVEAGSMTETARRLGISKSAVSSGLARLEQQLGARLLHRTTRKMRLTDAGQRFFDRGVEIVSAAAEAAADVSDLQASPVGTLRVSAPVFLGRRFLDAVVAEYLARHPQVIVEVDLSERTVDIVDEGYDVAVRAGRLADSSLVAFPLTRSRRLIAAAPSYIRRSGTPRVPSDLGRHECLLYRHQQTGDVWELEGAEGRERVRVSGRLRSNNGDLLAAACVRGAGVAFLPDSIVEPMVESGSLAVLLDAHCQATLPVHAVVPARRHL